MVERQPFSAAGLSNLRIELPGPRPAPELRTAVLLALAPLHRHVGVQLEGLPHDLHLAPVREPTVGIEPGHGGLQPAATDVAPRADEVGEDLDHQRLGSCGGRLLLG